VLAQTGSGVRFDVTTKNQATGVVSTVTSTTLAWSAAGDRIDRTIYDGDGRVAYRVDAEGFVLKNAYDGANNVTRNWRYAAAVSVANTATKATLDGLVPAGDPATAAITGYTYDAANRLTDVADATGAITHFVLDALGQITETHVAYGTADLAITRRVFDNVGRVTSETAGFGQPEAATTSYGYDALGRVTTVTNPRTFVTTRTYDNLGRMLTETVPLDASTSATTAYQYDARGNRVKVTDPRGNAGYFYYDAIDRLILQSDPEGYVTETAYAIGSNVSSVKRYASKASNLASVSISVKPTVMAAGGDATTAFTYDKLDRVKTTIDAQAGAESYVYDGLGNRTSMTNTLGGVTAYSYDKRGLLTLETRNQAAYDFAGTLLLSQVQTSFAYDARGNLVTKVEGANVTAGNNMSYARLTTTYTYDKLDRLLTQTDPTQFGAAAVTSYTYDKRGNIILQTAADGGKTYSFFDDDDRKTAEISPVGSLATWSYDAGGNVVSQKAYSAAVALPASPGGIAPIGAGTVRETQLGYDRNNRVIQSTIVNVRMGAFNGSTFVTAASQNLVSYNQYDSSGNLIKETDARGSAIFHFYDKNGREAAKVDQEGYVTSWTRDTNGNVLSEMRSAIKYTGAPVAGGAAPTVAASGDDRTTTFTYDKMGRRLTETRAALGAYTVGATGGLAADGTAASVTYTFNAMGEVLSKREATGDKTEYQYDQQGRLERQLDAVAKDFNSTTATLRHVSYFYYDANNNLVCTAERAETAAAAGGVPGTMGSYAAGYGAGDDRVTRFGYEGRSLKWTLDAADRQHNYWYDVMGRRTYDYYQRANSANVLDTTNAAYDGSVTSYDVAGRIVSQSQANYNSAGAWVTNGPVTQFGYNAFGEATARIVGGFVEESFDYDNAGHVIKTTGGDGVQKFVVYDANGNATLLIQSNGRNMSADTVDTALAYVGAIDTMGATDVVATITAYDLRNMATATREPNRRIANNADVSTTLLQTLVRSRGYNAFGEVTIEIDARGDTTNYYYNTTGRLTQKQNPFVDVTSEAGATASARATENYAYDISGRMVGVQTANGFWSTRTLQGGTGYSGAEGKVLNEFHPDSAMVETRYDGFGNARTLIDGIGRVSSQTFDKANNLTQVTRASGTTDYYAYDVLGQRVKHWTTAFAVANYGPPPLITPSQPIYGPAPIINNPVYGPAPVIGYDPYVGAIYGPAPIVGYGDPIYGPAPVIDAGGQPVYGPTPVVTAAQPIYGAAPITNNPVYGPAPIIGYDPYFGPIYGPAPIIGYGNPVYGSAPVIDPGGQPIYGQAPIVGYGMYGEPYFGEAPIVGYTGPTYGPPPVIGGTGPVYGPAPIVGYTNPVYGAAPVIGYTGATYGPAPIVGYTGPVYGPAPIIGYTNPVYGTAPVIGHTGPTYGPAPIIGYTGPVYGPAPIIGYTDPVYGAPQPLGYAFQYETTDYEIAGRVTRTVNFAGDTSTFSYAWTGAANNGLGLGGWTKTANLSNGHSTAETTDFFGRMLSRTDMGGRVYTFNYDLAGQLISQASTAGQNIAYTYYNTGKMATMADNAAVAIGYSNSNIDGAYTYDADGNRTYEKLQGTSYYFDLYGGYATSSTITLQEGRGTWDGLNRLTSFTDAGASGNGAVTLNNYYDAVGNVRRTYSVHSTIANDQSLGAPVTDDFWYKYDAMNQMTLVKGGLVGGVIVRDKDDSRSITYDLAGQRASEARTVTVPAFYDPYFSMPGYVYETRENFSYNLNGLLTAVHIATGATSAMGTIPASAGTGGTLRSQTSYDAAGRVTNATEYAADGTTVQYNRYDIVYDWRDNVLSERSSIRRTDGGSLYVYNATVTNAYSAADKTLTSVSTVNERLLNGSSWQDVPDTLTSYTYVWWDSAQQLKINFKPNTSSGTTYGTDLNYDYNGHLTSAYVNDGRPRSVSYINDANGQVMVRREQDNTGSGDPKQVWWYFDSRQVGTSGNNGNVDPDYETAMDERVASSGTGPFRQGSTVGTRYSDFDQSFNALSPGEGGGAGTIYTVRSGDTLDGIARSILGDSSLWYRIADANGLSGASRLNAGQQIRIPAQLANVHNTSDTFRPYDTAGHIGDLQPTTPTPPATNKKGCGVFGAIILAIVAIVVTVVTAGAALSVIAPAAFPTVGAGIGAVLGGTVIGAATVGVSVGTAIAVGATAAAVGSIVSQGLGVATGLQDKFNWKAVGLAAIGGGIGAGLAPNGLAGSNGFFGAAGSPGAFGTISNNILRAAGNAAAGNVITQGVSLATGLQKQFDWAGVAASGIGAGVGQAIGGGLPTLKADNTIGNHLAHLGTSGASLLANAGTRSIVNGSDFGDNIMAALPDVVAQTISNMIQFGVSRLANIADRPVPTPSTSHGLAADDTPDGAARIEQLRAADRAEVAAIYAKQQSISLIARGSDVPPLDNRGVTAFDVAPSANQRAHGFAEDPGAVIYRASGGISTSLSSEVFEYSDGSAVRVIQNQNGDAVVWRGGTQAFASLGVTASVGPMPLFDRGQLSTMSVAQSSEPEREYSFLGQLEQDYPTLYHTAATMAWSLALSGGGDGYSYNQNLDDGTRNFMMGRINAHSALAARGWGNVATSLGDTAMDFGLAMAAGENPGLMDDPEMRGLVSAASRRNGQFLGNVVKAPFRAAGTAVDGLAMIHDGGLLDRPDGYAGAGLAKLLGGGLELGAMVVPATRLVGRASRAEAVVDIAAEVGPQVLQVGGAYQDVVGIAGHEAHHMPADSVSPLSTREGPSIALPVDDHRLTASWGNSKAARAYRQTQGDLINQGDFRGAQQMDINDISRKFGNKYDDAVQQMLRYSESRGH
jgi:YD repeat-containing protein